MNNRRKPSISFLSVLSAIIITILIFFVTTSKANAASCSTTNCSLSTGNFQILNNMWGNPSATQSIFVNGGAFGWSWDNPSGGGWNAPEIYAGTARNCGASTWNIFPMQYKNLNSASTTISWKYTKKPTVGSWWDFAFDIYWMDNNSKCDQKEDKMFNIMIWINGKPEFAQGNGSLVKDNISDNNNTWSYYEYQHPAPLNWPWRAFVLKNRDQIPYEPVLNQQYSITINIKALMDSITDAPLDGNWYIPGIELGNENAGSNGSTSGGIEINQCCLNINGNQTCTNSTPPSPSATPTSMYVTPTIYCLGSCPTLPITPTTTESPSNQPLPSQSPVPSEAIMPTTEMTPIASPSPTQTPVPGKRNNIFEIIRDMILKIIQAILQFLLQLLKLLRLR